MGQKTEKLCFPLIAREKKPQKINKGISFLVKFKTGKSEKEIRV